MAVKILCARNNLLAPVSNHTTSFGRVAFSSVAKTKPNTQFVHLFDIATLLVD